MTNKNIKMYLKVPKKSGEKIRKILINKNALDKSYKILRNGDFLLFPIKKKISIPNTSTVKNVKEKIPLRASSLKDALRGKLSDRELKISPRSFDVIGDIAILELPLELNRKEKLIARTLLGTFPSIKVVCKKKTKVDTEYRIPGIEIILGDRTKTIHKEFGCLYKIDIKEAYFSPRLSNERMRIARQIKNNESVLVMFAGVGPYPISIAKKSKPKKVVAIELNPIAVKYMKENAKLNKVDIEIIKGDVRTETKKLGKFDRIIMPLPKDAGNFLNVALGAIKNRGIIHFYDFSHSKEESISKVNEICKSLGYKIKILNAVECGSYSPCLSRICVDFQIL